MDLTLSAPQYTFLYDLNTKFRGYVGGFGSGKTYVGCLDLLLFALAHPGTVQGYFGPTYPSIRDIFYPTIEEAADSMGIRCDIKTGDKEVNLYKGRKYLGKIICRSMDRPASIIGFKVARALVDEIDTMSLDKATQAWNKIIARLRLVIPGVVNGVGVTCTPEGFLFMYDHFKKNPTESYSMVQASTYENEEYLPPDYIGVLEESYPEQLVKAYVNGDFVNLTSGSVYPYFDRERNHRSNQIQIGEPLHNGMDFNKYHMAGIVYNDKFEIVDELIDYADTPAISHAIKERYPHNGIAIYPDASGATSKSIDVSISDISILRDSGFQVFARKSNPAIKDRVVSVNRLFEKGELWVDTLACPRLTECLEQQVYNDNGEPDKTSGVDHALDAMGYRVAYNKLIMKPSFRIGHIH